MNYVILVFFFEKNLFPKTWNPLITKWKILIGSSIFSQEALETCSYPEYVLRLQKQRQIWQKSKIHLPFLWKTRVGASKVITNSLKLLHFVTSIPLHTFPWSVLRDLSLMKLGNC